MTHGQHIIWDVERNAARSLTGDIGGLNLSIYLFVNWTNPISPTLEAFGLFNGKSQGVGTPSLEMTILSGRTSASAPPHASNRSSRMVFKETHAW